MGYLQPPDPATSPTVAELYRADEADQGYVANYTETFALRPDVYAAWQQPSGAIRRSMTPRQYEVATMAAARRLRSSYCALAHGSIMIRDHVSAQAVQHLVTDHPDPELTPEDLAIAALADKIATRAADVTAEDYAPLRALGFDDAAILDVVLATAARCFFSAVLDGTGTEPDPVYARRLSPDVAATLTVGRPIAAS